MVLLKVKNKTQTQSFKNLTMFGKMITWQEKKFVEFDMSGKDDFWETRRETEYVSSIFLSLAVQSCICELLDVISFTSLS